MPATVGFGTTVLLSPTAGDHTYAYGGVPPLAAGMLPMMTESCAQSEMVLSGPALATGAGRTVTTTVPVDEQPFELVTTTLYVVVTVVVETGLATTALLIPVAGDHR